MLTLTRAAIVVVACLCVGGVYGLVNGLFSTATSARDAVVDIIDAETSQTIEGTPTVLYFSENGAGGGVTSIYQVYYITGKEGAYGLVDAGGERLLDDIYEGVILLPHAYALKQEGQWRFFDRETMEQITEHHWDEAEVLRADNGRFIGTLVRVKKDGLYGAVNMRGEIAIGAYYDDLQMNSLQSAWPLIKVKSDGKYGFINTAGDTVISLSYDYAAMGTVTVYADENDAEGTEKPIVYVLQDGDWGAIYRNGDGTSSDVDWSVEPTAEVLEAYEEQI
ncbi:MAG: WG repeat-containing protein [Firmicutes bacterium]|nr:WG repeat-containing protein [Bacillota bacterium]